MIGLNIQMPQSCLTCPCGAGCGTWGKGRIYDSLCYVFKHETTTFEYKNIPYGTRPTDCPLIDLSRYEDDLK